MRADLRLSDLQQAADTAPSKLMNVKVPANVIHAIDRMADGLGCTKTDAVIALLNEGLEAFAQKRGRFNLSGSRRPRRGPRPKHSRAR